ncbi:MAG: MauE/DoxX family redox-associated membrane protein [Candidatus Zixiibacteriota bacterium]
MRRVIDNDLLTLLFRLAVGITFIYASYYKIVEPLTFARSIWYYHMVPGNLINLMALILPWIELICGLLLIAGVYYRGAVVWANIMVIIFIIALTTAIARGISIDCGCFKASEGSAESAWHSLWFDFGLIVLTVWLWLSRSRRWMLSGA